MKDVKFVDEIPRDQIYISIDIESDGPIPGEYSMLSLGAYAIGANGHEYGTFYRTLTRLPKAKQNPSTMKFWETCPEAYEEATRDPIDPAVAMDEFTQWLYSMKKLGQCQFVAYPAGFDFTFVHWYLHKFMGMNPIGFTCIDMKTYAMVKLGIPYKEVTKKHMPQRWKHRLPKHTHNALDDAKEQAILFTRMLAH